MLWKLSRRAATLSSQLLTRLRLGNAAALSSTSDAVPEVDLSKDGIKVKKVFRNLSVPLLYEKGVSSGDAVISSAGALIAYSGAKTGRSPNDKRIVKEPSSEKDVWWGKVNIPMTDKTWALNRNRAVDYLNTKSEIYVVDAFANWDPNNRIKVRIICARPYHALFMHNMLIRPTAEELANFGEPDFTIYNAGQFPANTLTEGMTSNVSVDVNFGKNEMVILGTEYAGEMKKGVFTVMNYLMPKKGFLSMHASSNEGKAGDLTLFFGLSGTGKTTLSADPHRALIGDDEHVWTESGVFNIEGGCYAKCINLTPKNEPEIFNAIRYGSILENVIYDKKSRLVDYEDVSIADNTRCSYPIEFIDNAKIPCVGGHPKNIIFLTCDAFGVLPPVSKLTPEQAMYHFISGYTSKMAGTEMGVTDPEATFSACFGQAFLVWHPTVYAELLAKNIREHKANAWLINTGWTGGKFGVGKRMSLKNTRAIIDAIHSQGPDNLANVPTHTMPVFNLEIPESVPGVSTDILTPSTVWQDKGAYETTVNKLAGMFKKNFDKYADGAHPSIAQAGPKI